ATSNNDNNNNNNKQSTISKLMTSSPSLFDEEQSIYFSDSYCEIAKTVFAESLTTLTEFILDKDAANVKYQLSVEVKRNPNFFKQLIPVVAKPATTSTTKNKDKNRMSLLFAVATRSLDIVTMLLSAGALPLINVPDPISKVTPLHLAVMLGDPKMVALLEERGADATIIDTFRAVPIDYAHMKGLSIPPFNPQSIQIYNYKNDGAMQAWPVERVERELSIKYCPRVLCTNDYLVNLCFSSFEINADMQFRDRYLKSINKTGGEENVILGWISDQVGWGVFAARDIKRGEYIVRYGGMLTMNEKMVTPCYNMMTSMEDFGLDAYRYRSMGGMVNHSAKHANAESECIFEYGAEQALITAAKFIPKGTQVFIDYSQSYWREDDQDDIQTEMVEMGGTDSYPSIIKF
ncbi:hypothetical protein SAMD00019534_105310, partial [Acytostelium subglobosum LB1]|uniref:hypothetical protein n=1 Tax=Acytostelium subglobosum LB1 TaxID=1410327 RepID=UPI0006448E3D